MLSKMASPLIKKPIKLALIQYAAGKHSTHTPRWYQAKAMKIHSDCYNEPVHFEYRTILTEAP